MELKTRTKKITVKSLQLSYKKGALSNNRAVNQQQYILMVDLPKVRYLKATSTQGPHSHMLMMGGPTEVHILYPKKSQLQNLSTQKKIPTFFSIPRKIPQCFCISKFYYLPSGKLKHANFNFGFGQKQNYTKTNTKSVHVCYSVSSSYLLRQLYRRYSL